MRLNQTIGMAILAAAGITFAGQAKADTCPIVATTAPPTCFYASGIVNLYYGTLTLDAPDGSLISTTNVETAATNLGDFENSLNQFLPPPASFIALFSTLEGQLQSDPQTTFANIPSWVFSGLTNLADANGFGLVGPNGNPLDPTAPGLVAFDTQLANVGGPYVTTSDTGFLAPPTTVAFCQYLYSLNPVFPCTPQTVPTTYDDYAFTYQLGPATIGTDTYTSLVNFQIYYRNVTEQLVATPEPSTMIPLFLGFAGILIASRRAWLKRTVWLTVFTATSMTFAGLAQADTCPALGGNGPTCFYGTDVVYLYYGTLTLDSPNGTVLSTTNLETAETGLGGLTNSNNQTVSPPAGLIAQFPSLVPQLQSDPQTTYANIPSWAITNIVNLADANGLGFVESGPFNQPPDPAVVAFDAQLSNVAGPYVTLSDTGFVAPLTTAAYCTYLESQFPGAMCTPQTTPSPIGDDYEFTYLLGPYTNDGDTYNSLVNFQIFYRDVTDQLVTPEPEMVVPLGVGLVIVGLLTRKRAKRA